MEKIEIFKSILESGGYTVFIYNDMAYTVDLVYDLEKKKQVFIAYSFNNIEYKTVDDLLENAYIDNIPLKDVIPNATDIYED